MSRLKKVSTVSNHDYMKAVSAQSIAIQLFQQAEGAKVYDRVNHEEIDIDVITPLFNLLSDYMAKTHLS